MLDDVEKKFVPQLDDPMPGQRTNALEMWREHNLKKDPPRHFRDLVADIDKALPPAEAEELKKKLAAYMKANDAAQKHDAAQKREIAELKAALWVKVNWKTIGAVAAALLVAVTGGWAYERYWSHSDAVMAGLRAAVTSEKWSEGLSEPAARMIGGEHYWLLFRGDIDASSYSDSHGRPLEMRCLHLYATPAEPDSGQYRKPSPRNFLGRINWPELAMSCKPAPLQKADK